MRNILFSFDDSNLYFDFINYFSRRHTLDKIDHSKKASDSEADSTIAEGSSLTNKHITDDLKKSFQSSPDKKPTETTTTTKTTTTTTTSPPPQTQQQPQQQTSQP